jgi:hypothetical protein
LRYISYIILRATGCRWAQRSTPIGAPKRRGSLLPSRAEPTLLVYILRAPKKKKSVSRPFFFIRAAAAGSTAASARAVPGTACVSADTVRSEVLWSDTPLLSRKGGVSVDPLRRVYSCARARRNTRDKKRVRDRNPAAFFWSRTRTGVSRPDRIVRGSAARCDKRRRSRMFLGGGKYLEESGDKKRFDRVQSGRPGCLRPRKVVYSVDSARGGVLL